MSTYLQYNNHMILHPTDSSKYFYGILDPLNPLRLPSYTIRLLYKDGVTPTFNKGTATQVSSSPNVWDLTYENSNWNKILSGSYDGGQVVHRNSLLKVLGANTTGVTNMSEMFEACEHLNELAIFDTSLVTTTEGMFINCKAITSVPDFDTRNVTNFVDMFVQSGLVVAPNFDTSSAIDMSTMFSNCYYLTSVPAYNTTTVTDMSGMFWGCQRLTSVPLMDTSNVTDMNTMFSGCRALTTIPTFNTSSVTDMSGMFTECTSLTSVPLMDTKNVTDLHLMFAYCISLTSIPLFDTRSATNMNQMFYNCTVLTTVPLLDTADVTNFYRMFMGCIALTSIPLFDTSSATNMNEAFYSCVNVTSGSLALYQQASSQSVPPSSHTDTFYNCGLNSTTGIAELGQIPQDWGGYRVDIGNQTWMSRNLAINDGQGGIYTHQMTYYLEYYYTLDAAIRVANSIPGWHLPSAAEWDTLANTVGSSTAGTKLKSTYGWTTGAGTDDYGFTAFPSGRWYNSSPQFRDIGTRAIFWTSSSDYNRGFDEGATMRYFDLNKKNSAFTVRLIKD